jgi:muramoyltetrapeptide carboxypeptidase
MRCSVSCSSVSDIHAMFSNTSVRAIVANRGGWGCNRIIDMLNYDLIRVR